MLVVPVIEQSLEVSYTVWKHTMVNELAKREGIDVPVIIKDLKIDHDAESWSERQWSLKGQLLDLDSTNCPEVFGKPLESVYEPVLVTGSSKSRVVFIEESIAEKVKALFNSPEEMISYGKAVTSEFSCYGLWNLEDVNVKVVPDEGVDLYRDGIGEISGDLLKEMGGLSPLIQFRAVRLGLSESSIAKGCLKLNPTLPSRTIVFTEGQIKGLKSEWNSKQDLWLGVLRNYSKPGKIKDSWTSLEIPANKEVKAAEIEPAAKEAHRLMDILEDPLKVSEYKGLIDREEGFSLFDQVLRVAVGSKTIRKLPPLENHPYIRLGLQDLMASKLRSLATDGATKWDYLLSSGTLVNEDGRAIKTSLYPIGTRLVVRRYPILLVDSYGYVTGPSDHPQTLLAGQSIRADLMMDDDGDVAAVIDCDHRYECTVKARSEMKKQVTKTHERLSSTFWETDSTIARNVGSSGIGSCTYSMLAAKIAGHDQEAEEMALELQKAVDSMKWSCRGDTKKAKEVLEEHGLPSHIAHRKDKKQFRKPETTDMFESDLWNRVAEVYKSRMAAIECEVLPLSAYSNLFRKDSHGLSSNEYRHLQDIYRWYCSRIKHITNLEDESYKQEKMAELFNSLRAWAADKNDSYICAAWSLCHANSSKNNRASFVFQTFRDGNRLEKLLAKVYKSESLERIYESEAEEILEDEVKSGLNSLLVRSGIPLEINHHEEDDNEQTSKLKTVALVNLQKPAAFVAGLIKSGLYEFKHDLERPLPGIGSYGMYVNSKAGSIAEVADKDVRLVENAQGKLRGLEVIEYRRSIKLIYT